MTNLLTPEDSDAVAVINAAIKRNAQMATDLEAEANGHENQAGEAKLRAVAYREANENLTRQMGLLNAPAAAPKQPDEAKQAAAHKEEDARVEKAWKEANRQQDDADLAKQQSDMAKPVSKKQHEREAQDERWLGGKPTRK